MATKRKASTKKSPEGVTEIKAAPGRNVAVWEDDPGDPQQLQPLSPINVKAPVPGTAPLAFRIGGTAPAAQIYQTGTANFRYWDAAAALRRTADFWAKIVPAGTNWRVGKVLPVNLDSGVDLNAYYTRGGSGDAPGLHFFHQALSGRTFFSGESPDVVCHEMGHGVLDAIRPQLFDAQTIEAAAFHEAFADCSALLSALQVPSFVQLILNETQGVLNRASRLSRLAEQLGGAIRMVQPDAVEPDCLRNAVNSFFYRDPQTLPPSGPASSLSSEPHSFSRVFTAGFLDCLAGILKTINPSPTAADVAAATQDAAKILVNAVLAAPVVPDYFSQVAAHMITVNTVAPYNGKYTAILKSAFVRRGILSLQSAAVVTTVRAPERAAAAVASAGKSGDLPRAAIAATGYGLRKQSLMVHTAGEPKRYAITSASLTLGSLEPRSAQNAAESYTEDLFQRGRVDIGEHGDPAEAPHPLTRFHTHAITTDARGDLLLQRIRFDCGLQSD